MAVSGNRIKRTRSQLAIAAILVVSACAPAPHREGAVGGGSAAMVRVGDVARDAGDPAVALPHYQRAHRLDPLNLVPIIRIAQTFNQLGAYTEAGDAWVSVLHLDHRNFDALVGYGNTLTALRQPVAALEYFERSQKVGETPVQLNGIGVAYDLLGNAGQAQEAYRRGLALAPGSLRLSSNLGLSLALSGDFAQAIKTLEAVVEMPGAGVNQRQNLALAYGVAGFTERAQTVGRQDMDELSVQRNLAFYRVVVDMGNDHAAKVAAVGARTTGGIPSGVLAVQSATAVR
jgi:Flp pilus assembly protein TadD